MSIQQIRGNIEEALYQQTLRYEKKMEDVITRRALYIQKLGEYKKNFHSFFLLFLSGKELVGDKRVPASVVSQCAKAKATNSELEMDIAKSQLDSAIDRAKIEEEKMNCYKKLHDARHRLGG